METRSTVSTVGLALRLWWWLLPILAVAGVVAGTLLSMQSPYSSTSLLRVESGGGGTADQQQVVLTALQLISTDDVYRQAATNLKVPANDLRGHIVTAAVTGTSLLSVTATEPDSATSDRLADGVAAAAVTSIQQRADAQFTAASDASYRILQAGALDDQLAETARKQATGNLLANRQNDALKSATVVTRVGFSGPATRAGLSPALGAIVGAFAGALLAALAAVVVGVRFRRVRRVSGLATLPGVSMAFGPGQRNKAILRSAGRASGQDKPLIAVLALVGGAKEVDAVSDELKRELQLEGVRCHTITTDHLEMGELDVEPERASDNVESSKSVESSHTVESSKCIGESSGIGESSNSGEPAANDVAITRDEEAVASGETTEVIEPADAPEVVLRPSPTKRPRPSPTKRTLQPSPTKRPALLPKLMPRRPAPALGLTARARVLSEVDADALLVVGSASDQVIDRILGRAQVVLLVGALGKTTYTDVLSVAQPLADSSPNVLIVAND